MHGEWNIDRSELEETTSQARLDALISWLDKYVRRDLPIRIRKKASDDLKTAKEPALKWVLEQLAEPRLQVGSRHGDGLDDLRGYVRVVEHHLDAALKEEVSRQAEWRQSASDSDRYDYEEEMAYAKWQFSDFFSRIFRYSLFITCYSFLEHRLEILCKRYERTEEILLKVKDISGEGIGQYRTYLKKAVGLGKEFPDQGKEWNDIFSNYRKLRNIIVHQNGLVTSDFGQQGKNDKDRNVIQFINNHSSIDLSAEIDGQRRIQLGNEFSLEFIDTLESFFAELRLRLP